MSASAGDPVKELVRLSDGRPGLVEAVRAFNEAADVAEACDGPSAPFPDLDALREALFADGHHGRGALRGPFADWASAYLDLVPFLERSSAWMVKRGVSRVHSLAWVARHQRWFDEAHAVLQARAQLHRARFEFQRALREARAAEVAEREARERERKAEVRRALADAARAASRVQGYCVIGPRDFDDVRPRWLYVLLGQDGTLYCGSALSVRERLRAHREGRGAAVTRDNPQLWFLLHAERLPFGQAALCAEFALLHSEAMQRAVLAARSARAVSLHRRFRAAVPWLGLS